MSICGSYAFSGSSFFDRKSQIFYVFFDLKKARYVEKHPEFQNLKKNTSANTAVAIGNPERHVRKASHRGSKQQ